MRFKCLSQNPAWRTCGALSLLLALAIAGCFQSEPAAPVAQNAKSAQEQADATSKDKTSDDVTPADKSTEEATDKPVDNSSTADEMPDETADMPDEDASEAPADEGTDDTANEGTEAPADEGTDEPTDDSAGSDAGEGEATKTADTDQAAAQPADDAAEINREWNQWAGGPQRNNTPVGHGIPTEWEPGEFEGVPAQWKKETSKNIKWVAQLGSQTYGNPVVANGKVFVGTNNGAGWLSRYPSTTDLGCLLAFNEEDGKFLWQHSSEKLPTGRVHDWEQQGICSAPLVEGDRLWFVTSRGQVACLDTEGFHDGGENDGPFTEETNTNSDEADVVWYLDMMGELQVSQHNMCSCSVTAAGDILFVCTSNGVDDSHERLPSEEAPSFLAMDKNTGKVLWQDNSPGLYVLHGQWSSPAFAVIDGVPQVIFGGGDGWLYSFRGEATADGKPELLWKFDCNPKTAKYSVSGRSTRNHLIATPVIYEGLVYIAVGEDPEHGEGNGHLWCIDPTKRGDVSTELAFKLSDLETPMERVRERRLQAVVETDGEVARANPNSAAVWHYTEYDWNGDGKIADFEEKMHRTCGTVTIKNNLLVIPDFSGLVHCLDAKTGKSHWTHDLFAATWGSALIVEDKIYVGDEEGKITIFKLAPTKEILAEVEMGNSVYTTPVVANNVLYIANKTHLFAIQAGDDDDDTAADGDDAAAGGEEAAGSEDSVAGDEPKVGDESAEETVETEPAPASDGAEPTDEATDSNEEPAATDGTEPEADSTEPDGESEAPEGADDTETEK